MTIHLSGKGGGADYPYFNEAIKFTGHTVGNNYMPSIPILYAAAATVVADYIYFTPFVPRADHTFVGISLYNTSAGENGDNFRLGIYGSDAAGDPDALVVDTGELTLTAAAALRTSVISEALTANTLYWLAYIGDSVSTYLMTNSSATNYSWYPVNPNSGFVDYRMVNPLQGIRESQAYGALPANAGTLEASGANFPIISLTA